jgi:hypothetical protein
MTAPPPGSSQSPTARRAIRQAAAPNPAAAVTHGNAVTAAPALAEYPDYAWPAPVYRKDKPAWPVSTR